MTHTPGSTTLQRFRRDRSGNALAIMAASALPMVAAVAAAIDMSRNYMVKSRLQQACDAGVLAGRKLQGAGIYADVASDANEYFRINFPTGLYGAQNISFTSGSADNRLATGTATAFVPATIAKFMGYRGVALNVTCSARLDVTDTDVMFVLDVTGSMNCPSDKAINDQIGCSDNGGVEYGSDESDDAGGRLNPSSRIGALRNAVINFVTTLNGAVTPSTEVRYGFVPYAGTVNVGHLLNSSWIRDSAIYVTRDPRVATQQATQSTNSSGQVSYSCPSGYTRSGTTCSINFYVHLNKSLDTSRYKLFEDTVLPSMRAATTSKWEGCIEERSTVSDSSFSPIPAGAKDLDIDGAASVDEMKWAPLWPEVSYYRNTGTTEGAFSDSVSNSAHLVTACVTAAKKMGTESVASARSYVLSLRAKGGTYHDIGMTWGLRLLSATGLWAAENADRPGNTRVRNIIFMTDGAMSPNPYYTNAYDVEAHANRIKPAGTINTAYLADLKARHEARFLAVCQLARNTHNVRVWAVALGEPLSNTQLESCAGPGRAFQADNASQLNSQFQQIATQIADLRLSQ